MKILSYIIVVSFFLFAVTSPVFAYTYKSSNSSNNSNNHTYNTYNYKYPVKRGHYASRAPAYRNPYPRKITDKYLQKLTESVYRSDTTRAPTGNYSRRAYMPNK
jgi:hypothetical protein